MKIEKIQMCELFPTRQEQSVCLVIHKSGPDCWMDACVKGGRKLVCKDVSKEEADDVIQCM